MRSSGRPRASFDPRCFIEESIAEIMDTVRDRKAISACSGGVDSTVASYLAYRAIGSNLSVIHIDDGMRREGEPEATLKMLYGLGMRTRLVDESERFFSALRGIVDAEEKRLAFRQTFYSVLGDAAKEEKAEYLVQGTIATDVVETVGKIKTQHNVLEQIGIDPLAFGFKLIEPLKDIYKPEVRRVARELGLPDEICQKMPYPGPGLCIRVLGEATPERVAILRKATKIVEEETQGLPAFQRFAVLHSDKATGIREGKRNFGNIITIRLVASDDAMTAKAIDVPYEILRTICIRIIDEIPDVSRCLYDITDKPPATIEFE